MKILIVGAGEVGFHIAGRLAHENKDVVVVDKDPAAIRRVSENLDVQVVTGSGDSPSILEEAGIKEAEIILAVTNSDEANLVACLMANMISPATKKLARIRNADFDKYHDAFRDNPPYIDTIINPEIEVVRTIQRLMKVPGAVEAGEFVDGRVKFIGIRLDHDSPVNGVRLAELPERMGKTRALVAAVVRDEELIVPRGNDKLVAGDLIYLIVEGDRLSEAMAAFGKQSRPLKRVLVVGGGRIGYRLANALEKKNVYTKIIEKDAARCTELAERMNKTVVLHGDGSDQNLLSEENIRDMDIVVTLTGDEETNILVSLLSKRMGASNAIAKINKFSYFPLMSAIGIEQVVSPRLSAIDSILQHIRRGKVLSAISINGDQAEVLEAIALPTSDIVGKPLKDVAFPKGALVIGIIRKDQIIIPDGYSQVEPDDRVIIFARRQAVPKVEKFLMVKLEFF